MLLKLMKCSRRLASTRKFHDVLADYQNNVQLPEFPEQIILSRHIQEMELQQNQDEDKKSFLQWEKSKSPQKQEKSYAQLLNGNPYGSIKQVQYKNHNLTLISTNYYRINEKKLHKFLYVQKPDAIVLQRRPQYHLHDFKIMKKGEDGIFSDREYLEQLKCTFKGLKSNNHLSNSQRPLIKALNKTTDDILEKHPEKQILQASGFKMCSQYISSYNSTNLYLSEMPSRCYRQWLANKNTLMQLQEMFKSICRRLPRYKNLGFTPYKMGTLIYPDTFLKINDLYMATIIEMIIANRKCKNIVGVFGIMENEAIIPLLKSGKTLQNSIIQLLVPPGPKGTIVRNIQILQIVQKHILLDIFFYGDEILDVETKYLHTTNSIIERYAKNVIDNQTIMKFRYEKTLQYIDLMKEKYHQGEEQIQKQFVRQTLRGKK